MIMMIMLFFNLYEIRATFDINQSIYVIVICKLSQLSG